MLAALAYLKIILKDGNVVLGLLACKSRVRNKLTIANGELLAFLDSIILANKLQKLLDIPKEKVIISVTLVSAFFKYTEQTKLELVI